MKVRRWQCLGHSFEGFSVGPRYGHSLCASFHLGALIVLGGFCSPGGGNEVTGIEVLRIFDERLQIATALVSSEQTSDEQSGGPSFPTNDPIEAISKSNEVLLQFLHNDCASLAHRFKYQSTSEILTDEHWTTGKDLNISYQANIASGAFGVVYQVILIRLFEKLTLAADV
jgi:hypothetical protein